MIKVISSAQTYYVKIQSVLPLLLLLSNIIFAQREEDRPVTESAMKITFIEPGIAHKFPLGTSTSFFLRGGTVTKIYFFES
jgi:hypothetical protein